MERIALLLVVFAVLILMALVAFPPGTDYSIEKMAAAYVVPDEVGYETMAARYELESDVVLVAPFGIAALLGGLIYMAVTPSRRGK